MGAVKVTKVIDCIGGHYIPFGDAKSWYGIWCLSVPEASSATGMLSHAYQAHSQSSLKVQDGLSFFFQKESARSVPFLPEKKTVLSPLNGLCSLSETEVLSPGLCPHFET